ncbi:hypothetical protein MRB53_016835 [Persea americana]|uniref:Uncharacterized protein n=1 Tax=Persea americana TaxID=3435 RepID=A0ACC2M3E1_PERAE|nr:hypothetical protein MRB53_016835 [Persea americana]
MQSISASIHSPPHSKRQTNTRVSSEAKTWDIPFCCHHRLVQSEADFRTLWAGRNTSLPCLHSAVGDQRPTTPSDSINFDGEGNLDEDGQQDVLPWEVICFSAFKKRCIRSHPKKSIYCALCVKNPISQLVPRQSFWRIFAMSIDLEEEPSLLSKGDNLSDNDEVNRNDSSEKFVSQHLDSHELKALLADSERSKLVKKLSEANQYNRFLKRQLQFNEDTLINFKSELAVLELELQTSVGLAEEVAKSGTYQGSRKINGKYVPSYLLSRLEAIHRRLKEQIKGIDAVKVRDVEFFWYGMAEIVQVMGSFDGWSHGEHMSPEYQGGFTKFSTVLKLRPGRYEIKFLVDGEWHLSPELPIIENCHLYLVLASGTGHEPQLEYVSNRDCSPVSFFVFNGDDGRAARLQGGGDGSATAIVQRWTGGGGRLSLLTMGDRRRKMGAVAFSDAGVGWSKATGTEGGSGLTAPAIDPDVVDTVVAAAVGTVVEAVAAEVEAVAAVVEVAVEVVVVQVPGNISYMYASL